MNGVRVLVCSGGSWTAGLEGIVYKPLGLMRRAMELDMHLTYSQLDSLVIGKLKPNSRFQHKLSYQFPFSSSDQVKPVVVEIADDEDVKIFLDVAKKACNASSGPITLYVQRN